MGLLHVRLGLSIPRRPTRGLVRRDPRRSGTSCGPRFEFARYVLGRRLWPRSDCRRGSRGARQRQTLRLAIGIGVGRDQGFGVDHQPDGVLERERLRVDRRSAGETLLLGSTSCLNRLDPGVADLAAGCCSHLAHHANDVLP